MSDTDVVEPYDLDWLAPDGRIREIVTRYNNPDSPQRKMLATLDLVWNRSRELEAIVRDLDIDTELWSVSCPWNCSGEADGSGHDTDCPWRRLREWVSAHPVSGDQP